MTYLMMLTMWTDGAHAALNNRTRALMELHADEMSAIYAEAKAAEEGGK